ncbi:MAG: DUF3445 domain-containing protein [Candidatus Tectomicrobia bacterium]|uniref:DUF3445 domain-containing protein n=1 Tax=Tectimicrobiota bacterium TaxID=2528274 RepID=A0A938B168_UNCTE|nr:DUF3445 domain-containing protein [Candidatus Tectomicrobia bacterium]
MVRPPRVTLSAPEYDLAPAVPFHLTMGLSPLALHDWIAPDADLAHDLREKERLLHERHAEVFHALPAAAASSAEVLALLAAHLPERFPTFYRRDGAWLEYLATGQRWPLAAGPLHPLDIAGRLVQEDLCLMQPLEGMTTYTLVGASVCFPTRWRLAEKIGTSLGAIHDPVPGYDTELAPSMERLFARLKVERPVWRLNWSLMDDPALFQPTGHGQTARQHHLTAENAGTHLWLRMERQTLRRLPQTGAILFTIRVYVRPLHRLVTHPAQAAALAATIRTMPPAMQEYKSLTPFLDAVLGWLDSVAPPVKHGEVALQAIELGLCGRFHSGSRGGITRFQAGQ